MSKARKRKPRTEHTRERKNLKVFRSSHKKFDSVIALEEHRKAVTKKNKKG